MEVKTKHRIIGVVVLVALAVIIIPMFFAKPQTNQKTATAKTADDSQAAVQLAAAHPANNDVTKQTAELATQALQPSNDNNAQDNASRANADQTNPDQANVDQAVAPTSYSTIPSINTEETSNNAAASTIASASTAKDSSTIPVDTLKPVSTTPKAKEITHTSPVEATRKKGVPRTKTGATKKHLVEAEKKAAHEKLMAKQEEEKVKHAALTHAWTIQLASFTQKVNAQLLVKQLRAKGFAAYIHEGRSSKGEVNRVFVGPELKKERADLMLKKLHDTFRLKGVVVEYKV